MNDKQTLVPGRVVVTAQRAALAGLRDRIASGDLRPGDQVRQEAIAAECGLSVPPVREALRMLEAEGLVTYIPNRGYFIARLSMTELEQTYRLRDLLESEAISLGTPRLLTADFLAMESLLHSVELSGDDNDITNLTDANKEFHFTIFHASDVHRLENFIRILWESTDPYRSIYFADVRHRDAINAEHLAILDAARRGAVEEVVFLSRAHRENGLKVMRALLDEDTKSFSRQSFGKVTGRSRP